MLETNIQIYICIYIYILFSVQVKHKEIDEMKEWERDRLNRQIDRSIDQSIDEPTNLLRMQILID